VFDRLPMDLVPKENHDQCSRLNNLSTKNILSDSTAVHAQYLLLIVHEQTSWVLYQNRIHQT
jgi:hypothetical protein